MANNYASVYSIGPSKVLAVTTAGTDTTTHTPNTLLRLTASTDMFVALTTTASTTTSMFMTGGVTEYVQGSDGNIAAITAVGTGSLYITEVR